MYKQQIKMKPICTNCIPVNNIPKCLDELVIGSIADLNTGVFVYLSTSTDKLIRFSATSDGAGVVILDTMDFEPNQVMKYNLWVTLQTAGMFDALDLTIEGSVDPVKCISFNFENIFAGNGSVISFPTQTVLACA